MYNYINLSEHVRNILISSEIQSALLSRERVVQYNYATEAERILPKRFAQAGNRTRTCWGKSVVHGIWYIAKIAPNAHETFSQTFRKCLQGAREKNSPRNLTYT